MMNDLGRYIFPSDILQKYASEFNNYAIEKIYGKDILIGSEIEDDYKHAQDGEK